MIIYSTEDLQEAIADAIQEFEDYEGIGLKTLRTFQDEGIQTNDTGLRATITLATGATHKFDIIIRKAR